MARLTPIIGAVIADSFAGRFWTFIAGTLIYQLMGAQYVSLLFTSLGSGGIQPCVVAFGADQFELSSSRSSMKTFNWYYFSIGIATLLALTVVVCIHDNVGWVGVWACRPLPSPSLLLHLGRGKPLELPILVYFMRNRALDADISTTGRLLHTDQFKFFDRAAIATPGDNSESDQPNLWKISTVHRVEELKSIIRMLLIWSVGILRIAAASSHQSTFVIQQARSIHLTRSFQIPPATMSVVTIITFVTPVH